MKHSLTHTVVKVLAVALFASAALFMAWGSFSTVFAGYLTSESPTVKPQDGGLYRNYSFFASSTDNGVNATTTSATSSNIIPYFDAQGRYDDGTLAIAGAKKVTFYFSRGDTSGAGNTGRSVFSVEVSPDGTTWYDFDRLIGDDLSATATSSVTINAATSTFVGSMDLTYHNFLKARCVVVETTDGEHTCRATAEY